ncbi:TetR/AcrR family transcriptional regulator [soil metagenome]
MAVGDRKEREREKLRTEILDAAREMFVTEGYRNVSMRKIADRIEYSPTTIYTHFRDKAELLHAVCESTFEALSASIIDSWRTVRNPLEALRNGMVAYIDFGLANPHHYEVVFITPLDKFDGMDAADFDNSLGKRSFEPLLSAVTDCMEEGLIRPGDVLVTAQTLWAGIHGTTSLLITHNGFPGLDRETLVPAVVDTLIAGLVTKKGKKL